MGIVRKQAFGNSLISYAGILIGYANVALIFPRLLDAEVFGLTQVLISAMLFSSNLGSFGLQYTIIRYHHIFKLKGVMPNAFFSFIALASVGCILITSLALWVFADPIKAFYSSKAVLFSDNYLLLYPLLVFGIMTVILDSYSRAVFKSVLTAFYREVVNRILQLILVVSFFYDLLSFDQFIRLFVMIQGIYVLLMFISLNRLTGLSFNFDFSEIKKKMVIDMAKFSSVSMFSSSKFLTNNSDVLLVSSLVGLKATAIYSVASAVGRVVMVPSRSVNRVATSVVAEAWGEYANHKDDPEAQQKQIKRIDSLYAKSALNNLILGGAFFLAIVVNLKHLIAFLPKTYESAESIMVILSLAKLVGMTSGINGGIIASSRHYAMNMYYNTSGFISLILLSIWLISKYEITGAAYASLIVVSGGNIARYLFLKIKYGMEPFSFQMAYVVLTGAAAFGLHLLLPELPNMFLDLAMRCLLCVGAYVGVIYFTKWSPDFSELLNGILKKITGLIKAG